MLEDLPVIDGQCLSFWGVVGRRENCVNLLLKR